MSKLVNLANNGGVYLVQPSDVTAIKATAHGGGIVVYNGSDRILATMNDKETLPGTDAVQKLREAGKELLEAPSSAWEPEVCTYFSPSAVFYIGTSEVDQNGRLAITLGLQGGSEIRRGVSKEQSDELINSIKAAKAMMELAPEKIATAQFGRSDSGTTYVDAAAISRMVELDNALIVKFHDAASYVQMHAALPKTAQDLDIENRPLHHLKAVEFVEALFARQKEVEAKWRGEVAATLAAANGNLLKVPGVTAYLRHSDIQSAFSSTSGGLNSMNIRFKNKSEAEKVDFKTPEELKTAMEAVLNPPAKQKIFVFKPVS